MRLGRGWGFYGFRLGAGAGRGKEAGVGEVEGGVKSPDTLVLWAARGVV